MKELYYDRDYVYLVHGTNREPFEMNSFLEKGLVNWYGANLGSTLYHIPSLDYYREIPNLWIKNKQDLDEKNYLETQIRNYTHSLYLSEMNVIVKIPLKWFDEENGKPIWRKAGSDGWAGNNCYFLLPELIYGFYLRKTDEFVFNKNYGKIESFEGLEYDDPWNLICFLDYSEQDRLKKLKTTDSNNSSGESNLKDDDLENESIQKPKRNKIFSKIFKSRNKRN